MPDSSGGISAAEALDRLREGNARFAAGSQVRPHQTAVDRERLAAGQHPFAAVLCCSDSRVSPELVFDQGLGDLFVVRVAGNVAEDIEVGSLEYAAAHLHVPLILVLGHSGCGAVTAAVQGGGHEGHVRRIVNAIQPSVSEGRRLPGVAADNVARINARRIAERLRESRPVLHNLVRDGKLQVAAGFHDLHTGIVEFPG